MPLTIGLTGMDPATETALKSSLMAANERLNGLWRIVPEAEAQHVIVDMDSMYGPMSWLRLHAAGKKVIGLTSAPRTQTDFRLGRPFDEAAVTELLAGIAAGAGIEPARQDVPPSAPEPVPAVETAPPVAEIEAAARAPAEPGPAPAAPAAAPQPPAAAHPAPAQEPAPAPVPGAGPDQPRPLAEWLSPALLPGRVRFRRNAGPTLLIDATAGQYHGPSLLKPLVPYFEGTVSREEFEELDEAAWARETAAAGPVQSLTRLIWLGGLLGGKGRLLPGFDPAGRYRLVKWPQTEREFPRHFRIATAMMKGPATLSEIAAACGVPVEDVADFVNANMATGYAEFVPDAPPEAPEPPRPGGLFSRLRGR